MLGKQHSQILAWLESEWWLEGPPVTIVQGFPGVGKTELGIAVSASVKQQRPTFKVAQFDCPDSVGNTPDDFLLTLAGELAEAGDPRVAEEIGTGKSALAIAAGLLGSNRLLVIDEADRLLSAADGTFRSGIKSFFEKASQTANPIGRMLLLSSREIAETREAARIKRFKLEPFDQEDALEFLREQLDQHDSKGAVEAHRQIDVVNWLGRNARAIRLLAAALTNDELDDLIGLAPEAWEARDRIVSPDLLYRFEQELLSRTEQQMAEPIRRFARRISVLRKPFKRGALEALNDRSEHWQASRDELIARYILDSRSGWYKMHPVLRETLVTSLPSDERRSAHLAAGRYYAAAFRAKSLAERPEALGMRFIEARYHYTLGESEADLAEIAQRFETHLRGQYGLTSRIPSVGQELDERIALLSALLQARGAVGLEFHLAKCLVARNGPGDLDAALPHARRATGPKSRYDAWLLRIRIENEVLGFESAIRAAREGIKVVAPTQSLSSLYQSAAGILAANGKPDEAVSLLREGIKIVPPTHSLSELCQSAAEILAANGRPDEAVTVLREGIKTVAPTQSLFSLYQSAAEILAANGKSDEAITLLRGGIRAVPPTQNLCSLYQSAAEILAANGKPDEAVTLLHEGLKAVPPTQNLFSLYLSTAQILAANGKSDEAVKLLREGIEVVPPTQNLGFLYRALIVMLDRMGNNVEADVVLADAVSRLPKEGGSLERYRAVSQRPFNNDNTSQGETLGITMLLLGTEWFPQNGGLSRFNRDLCCALAASGINVSCVVLDASSTERLDAAHHNVNLISASLASGISAENRLLLKIHELPENYLPDYIVGHGRITGPAAAAQIQFYPSAKRIHFVHMSPDEIEWLKTDRLGDVAARAEERTGIEIDLATDAHRAIAVGPRLFDRLARDLSAFCEAPPPLVFVPGFDIERNAPTRRPPPGGPFKVLLMCRAEDEVIKGLDIAAKALARIPTASIGRVELCVRGSAAGSGGMLQAKLAAISKDVGVVVRNFSVDMNRLDGELRSASLALMPSRAEGFGLFGAEAIVAGTPSLISAESGLGELLQSLLHGTEFPPVVVDMSGDENALVERWASAISAKLEDREGAFAAADRLRRLLAERFPWHEQIAGLMMSLQ
jgi:glycosyltransferase involved in cell wall biosynthesis/tetratricopeptide (TPR) repeat protein